MTPSLSRPAAPLVAGLLCLLVAAAVIVLDAVLNPAAPSLREGGGVESASALLYAVPILLCLTGGNLRRNWMTPLLLAAMALRELDADKRFTSEGVLGIKILTHDTALWEKVLGLVVVVTLLAALWLLLRRYGRTFAAGVASLRPWALYLAGGLVLAAVTKSIDGLGRKLRPLGIDVSEAVNSNAGRVEEVLELGIPVLLAMSAVAALGAASRSARPHR